ncbi:hypothetical protein FBU30_002414 [Linnemannia zychae]|nr:hypothetical protein FBU30_002414 [Linnemannia zychae]
MQHPRINPKYALSLPEILAIVSNYVLLDDYSSCLLVNKVWRSTFLPLFWKSVHLSKYVPLGKKNFRKPLDFTQQAFTKYAHLVQSIEGLYCPEQLSIFEHAFPQELQMMSLSGLQSDMDKKDFVKEFELQKQKGISLKLKEFNAKAISLEVEILAALQLMCSLPSVPIATNIPELAPVTHNVLRKLSLRHVAIQHTVFSNLLRCSPHLTDITLIGTEFNNPFLSSQYPGLPSPELLFKCPSVRTLDSPISQVLLPCRFISGAIYCYPLPLFVHFPNLQSWNVSSFDNMCRRSRDLTTVNLANAIKLYSPLLKEVNFQNGRQEVMNTLLSCVFKGLQSVKIIGWADNGRLVINYGLGAMSKLLSHYQTLVVIDVQTIFPVQLPTARLKPWCTMFSKIVHNCAHLRVLSAHQYIVDLKSFEYEVKDGWACQELETLRLKIRELEAPAEIDECLYSLKCLRNSNEWRLTGQIPDTEEGKEINPIYHSVINKLGTLRRLKTVWLGTGDFHLATIP